jgi:hypothetical protein
MIFQIRRLFDELKDAFPFILHVDDLFLTRYEKLIVGFKRGLVSEFEMKDIGLRHYFMGLEVWQRSDNIFLIQGKYIFESLQRFRMMDDKSMTTPMTINLKLLSDKSSYLVDPTMYRQLIGSLMYLVNTRLDICFALNTLSQHNVEPRQVHWMETKHMLRYLHGMVGYGLRYVSSGDVKLHGYTDSDWEGSAVDEKSNFGFCFSLGSCMISWLSRKQTSVALNTSEAEYITKSVGSREAMWLRKFLVGIFDLELEPTLIHCEKKNCVKLTKNLVFHDRSKHIEIKYHYI